MPFRISPGGTIKKSVFWGRVSVDEDGIQSESIDSAGSGGSQYLAGSDWFEIRFLYGPERGFGENPMGAFRDNRPGYLPVRLYLEADCCFSFDSVATSN